MYSNLLVHVIFSTKDRQPTIDPSWQTRLYKYMSGIAREEVGKAIKIGGVADHLHGLLSLRTDVSVAHAMNRWKSLSSGWVNKTVSSDFAWQLGYGAFSVSESNAEKVIEYIERQEEHHRTRTFQEEYFDFLRRHRVEFDPATIWD